MAPNTNPEVPASGDPVADQAVETAAQIINTAPTAEVVPPMPAAPAETAPAPDVVATPNVTIGPPPPSDPERAMAELPPEAHLTAPAPVEAAPLQDPNLPEQKQAIKITTITGN